MFQYCEDFKDGDDKVISEGGYKSLTPVARLRILNVRIPYHNLFEYSSSSLVRMDIW